MLERGGVSMLTKMYCIYIFDVKAFDETATELKTS